MKRSSIFFITFIITTLFSSMFFSIYNKSTFLQKIFDPISYIVKPSKAPIQLKNIEATQFLKELNDPEILIISHHGSLDLQKTYDSFLKNRYPFRVIINPKIIDENSDTDQLSNKEYIQTILSKKPIGFDMDIELYFYNKIPIY